LAHRSYLAAIDEQPDSVEARFDTESHPVVPPNTSNFTSVEPNRLRTIPVNKSLTLGVGACLYASSFLALAAAEGARDGARYSFGGEELRLQLGGTLHLDGNWVDEYDGAGFGSGAAQEKDSLFVRRAILSFSGRVYATSFRIEPDLTAADSTTSANLAFQDAYVSWTAPGGDVQLGQRRPFHGMEDLTDSNAILMMERPFASSAGAFAGGQRREFAPGLYYRGDHNGLAWGIGGYSLRGIALQGAEGAGASARLTYAPLSAPGETVHLGLSVTWEDLSGDGSGSAGPANLGTAVAYAGRRGPAAVIGLTGDGESATTLGIEYANVFGPFLAQAEFMIQNLRQAGAAPTQDVFAYYVQAGYLLTGETRLYDSRNAVFRAPRPLRRSGAWELTARYDGATNRDVRAVGGGCGGGPSVNDCSASAFTVGTNYYLNPGTRLMLNYGIGEQDRGSVGRDRPRVLAARIQFSF